MHRIRKERRSLEDDPLGGRESEASDLVADYERRGDYLVPTDTLERAEAAFEARSSRSKTVDRQLRAPITGSFDRWMDVQGRGLDFPGIDTPSNDPLSRKGDHGRRESAGRPDHEYRCNCRHCSR